MSWIFGFRRLCLGAVACLVAGVAWFALSDLAQRGKHAAEASCGQALEEQATDAWLARAFDLSRVPGDPATAPLGRMLADPRDVFVPSYAAGSFKEQMAAIREGDLLVVPEEPPQPLRDIHWSISDFGNYYETKLHGWSGLGQLLESRKRLPEDVEDAIAFVIRDWFRCTGAPPGVSSRTWYEGAIVMRLSAILLAIDYYRTHGGLGDLRFIDLLYLAVTNKDELLVADYLVGNHGLRHDTVLISFLGNLPYAADHDRVRELVEHRLNAMSDELFSAEGVWKEHAPGYVYYALRHLTALDRAAKGAALTAELPILDKAAASADYLRQVLTPEGELPPIGMSSASRMSRTVANYWDIEVAEPYLVDRSVLFEDTGQAVYSSSSGGGLYVLVQAAQNLPADKRHADELSFIVHNHGRWWVVDSGHYTYEPTPISEFFASARAHNTYIRGDRGLGYDERPELEVALTGYSDANGAWQVSGRSERFLDGASFERTFRIDKTAERISLRDSIDAPSGADQTWRGFLHFAPDLEVELDGDALIAKDPVSGREMRLSIEGAEALRIVAGEEEPPQGWVAQGKKRLIEAPVLEFETDGAREVTMAIGWS